MHRRSFLTGLLSAPVVITTQGLLMPVRALPIAERTAPVLTVIYEDCTLVATIDGVEYGRCIEGKLLTYSRVRQEGDLYFIPRGDDKYPEGLALTVD